MNALRRRWLRPWAPSRDIRCQTRTLAAPGADGTAVIDWVIGVHNESILVEPQRFSQRQILAKGVSN